MARLAAFFAFATCALAQERTWEDAQKESDRLYREGKIEDAADALAEACRLAEAAKVPAKDRAGLEGQVASMLRIVHRTEEAEAHRRKAVELLLGAVPALDPSLAGARVMLAGLEAEHGRLDEAALDACTALEAAQGVPELETVCLAILARVSFGRRQYGTAMHLMKLAVAKVREAEPEPRSLSFGLAHAVAGLALGIGNDEVAERMLAEIEQMLVGRMAVGANPADRADVVRLGVEFLTRKGRLEEAERFGRDSLAQDPKLTATIPIQAAALTVALARVALGQDDLERAAACLEQAEPALRRPGYDTRSELSAFLYARAELRLRQGDRARARADLEEALRLDSRDGENGLGAARTLLALARVESEDGAHARAMDYAARATRIFLREVGYAAPECRRACETYGLFRTRALEAGLKEVPALTGMRLGEALEPDAEATDGRVRELLAGPGTLARLDEALALRPGEPTVHAARARFFSESGRHEDAVAAADAMIAWSLDPQAAMYALRATLNSKLGRHDRLIVDVTYALLLGDDDLALRGMRSVARLRRDGEEELALRDLDLYIKARPERGSVHALRGHVLLSLGRLDEASAAFRAAIDAGARPGDAYARLARIERCRGNVDLALAEAGRALEASPKGLEAYGVRGFIRLDRGEWKEALADFEAWAGDEPPSLYGRILQWICRAHLGEREAASTALRAAIDGEREREDVKAVARAILGEGPVPPADPPATTDRAARDRQCEAHFLLGAWREVEGDPAGARANYERSVAMDRPSNLEHESAKVALARLAGGR